MAGRLSELAPKRFWQFSPSWNPRSSGLQCDTKDSAAGSTEKMCTENINTSDPPVLTLQDYCLPTNARGFRGAA